jgi:hypothetical protein
VPELLGRLFDGGPRSPHPGVVHQAVDLPELGHGEVDQGRAGVRVGDVGRLGAHLRAPGREFGRHLVQALGTAPGQHRPAADRGDGPGEADAQARGRAGDDDDPAIETESLQGIHHVLRVWAKSGTTGAASGTLTARTLKDHYAT